MYSFVHASESAGGGAISESETADSIYVSEASADILLALLDEQGEYSVVAAPQPTVDSADEDPATRAREGYRCLFSSKATVNLSKGRGRSDHGFAQFGIGLLHATLCWKGSAARLETCRFWDSKQGDYYHSMLLPIGSASTSLHPVSASFPSLPPGTTCAHAGIQAT